MNKNIHYLFYTSKFSKIRTIFPSVNTAKLLFTLRRLAAKNVVSYPVMYWVYFDTLGIHGGRTVLRGYHALERNE